MGQHTGQPVTVCVNLDASELIPMAMARSALVSFPPRRYYYGFMSSNIGSILAVRTAITMANSRFHFNNIRNGRRNVRHPVP
jgi:hypothetical protein